MKLKKIASLALAGIMAVSMLAACGSKGSENGNETETATSTSIVDVVNKAQSANNKVKITFTDDAALSKALKTAAEVYGFQATTDGLEEAIHNMIGVTEKLPGTEWVDNGKVTTTGLLSGKVIYDNDYSKDNGKAGKEDGTVYTLFAVEKFEGGSYPTEESVLNKFADTVDEKIAELANTSDDTDNDGKLNADVAVGDKYYSYSYKGNVSMVSVKNPSGIVDYYVAYVVEQTVTEKKL